MPTGNPRDVWIKRMGQRLFARRETQKQHEELLPPDFAGQVYTRAREQAAAIRDRLAFLNAELEKVEAEIKATRRAVWEASTPVTIPGKVKGDILTEFTVEPARPNPNSRRKGPEALKVQEARLGPLVIYRRRLLAEQQGRLGELGDLRRICTLAAEGNVALINFLHGRWSGVFQLGAGMKLPQPAKMSRTSYVDAAGFGLPPEALDAAGQPDMPRVRA